MRIRRRWLPALAILTVGAAGVAVGLLGDLGSTTVSSESSPLPLASALARCPHGLGGLQLSADEDAEPLDDEAGPGPLQSGTVRSWTVSPLPARGWFGSDHHWSSWVYRAPGMEPVAVRGGGVSNEYQDGRVLLAQHYQLHLDPDDAAPGQQYLLVLRQNDACGSALFST